MNSKLILLLIINLLACSQIFASPPHDTEPELVIGVISSVHTLPRMVASGNTWVRHGVSPKVRIDFFLSVPLKEQEQFTSSLKTITPSSLDLPARHPFTGARLTPPSAMNIVLLDTPELKDHKILDKTLLMWQHLSVTHPRDGPSWYYKCDDDTFVFIPNMLSALKDYDPDQVWFLGRKLFGVLNSGGAGYFFSRGLMRLAPAALRECRLEEPNSEGGEDSFIAGCLKKKLGVSPTNLPGLYIAKPYESVVHHNNTANEHLSRNPISFHWITPQDMFSLEYLFYYASIFKPKLTVNQS